MPAPTPEGSGQGPTQGPRRSRLWRYLIVGSLLSVIAAALAAFSWLVMTYPREPGPGEGATVSVQIDASTTLSDVALQLAAEGAISRPQLWALYARIRGAQEKLRQGEVLVHDNMTPLQLMQRVARGYGAAEVRVVIPEGYSRYDIARRFASFGLCSVEQFLERSADPQLLRELSVTGDSAEGFLFPDTYRLHDAMGGSELVRRLVRTAERRIEPLRTKYASRLRALEAELGLSARDVVILASIVEKEAAVRAEQPIIAGVFLNRLRDPEFRPKRLQADPTVAYGCLRYPKLASCQGFDGRRVTRQMLLDPDNPYNTYRHAGLPPGPIANPGVSAMVAVLEPAVHGYYYFVARGDGSHVFSATLDDHNEAVDDYQR